MASYTVTLAGCARLLRPLQSLRLVYRDAAAGIDVDRDVNILSATWEVTAAGIQTTAVELSTGDLWPQDDRQIEVIRALSPSSATTGSSAIRHRSRSCSSVTAVPSGATAAPNPASDSAMTSM